MRHLTVLSRRVLRTIPELELQSVIPVCAQLPNGSFQLQASSCQLPAASCQLPGWQLPAVSCLLPAGSCEAGRYQRPCDLVDIAMGLFLRLRRRGCHGPLRQWVFNNPRFCFLGESWRARWWGVAGAVGCCAPACSQCY